MAESTRSQGSSSPATRRPRNPPSPPPPPRLLPPAHPQASLGRGAPHGPGQRGWFVGGGGEGKIPVVAADERPVEPPLLQPPRPPPPDPAPQLEPPSSSPHSQP